MTKMIDPKCAADLFAEGGARPGDKAGLWEYVAVQHIRTTSCQEAYWLVVRDQGGDLYGVEYREGLTGNQRDSYPWDTDGPLPLVRLYEHLVIRVEYRETPAEVAA